MVATVIALLTVHALKFGSMPVNSLSINSVRTAPSCSACGAGAFSGQRYGMSLNGRWPGYSCRRQPFGCGQGAHRKITCSFLWFGASYLFTYSSHWQRRGKCSALHHVRFAPAGIAGLYAAEPDGRGERRISGKLRSSCSLCLPGGIHIRPGAKPHPFVSGYEQAAEFVAEQEDTGLSCLLENTMAILFFTCAHLIPKRKRRYCGPTRSWYPWQCRKSLAWSLM